MRTAWLLALTFLALPTFVQAADSPTFTTYTISHGTIYPTATAGSGLATTTTIDIAFSEQVKTSIKILSTSGTMVKLLYTSSSVTNPTPKIWDGMNTAGTRVDNGIYTILISATSTASDGLTVTDSSKTITVASSGSSLPSDDSPDTVDATTDTTTSSSGGGPTEYLPIPMLRIITGGDRTVSSGADTAFTATVYDGKGNKRDDAVVTWSFGDGMRRTGASVFHTYYESGEYLAVVRVITSDGGDARSEIVITVQDASITIASVSSRGITLANNDSRTLDLSSWRLSMGGQEFKIPADTQVLAGHTVIFSSRVIQLPLADSAFLLYPSGEVAATYPTSVPVSQTSVILQPTSGAISYKQVQTVEPSIISTKANIQAHEEAVIAPSAVFATETAEGAALPTTPEVDSPKSGGLFKSPWFYSLLGVIALAGSAFIFL